MQTTQAQAPYPRRSGRPPGPATAARRHQRPPTRPETAEQPRRSSHEQPASPAAALRAIPALTHVRPILPAHAVAAFIKATENRPKNAIDLLVRELPVPQGAIGLPLAERLLQGLAALSDMNGCTVFIDFKHKVTFGFEWDADGYYNLHGLAEETRRLDPHWLPSVIAAVENWTYHTCMIRGPRAMEPHAEYWWDTERLMEELGEEIYRIPEPQRTKLALKYARRKGLPHIKLIQDQTPHRYYVPEYKGDEVVERTRALSLHPDAPAWIPSVARLLEELQTATAKLPDGDDFLETMLYSPMSGVIGVVPEKQCFVAELSNEYMEMHWQSGEESPQQVITLEESQESRTYLTQYLEAAPVQVAAAKRLLELLGSL